MITTHGLRHVALAVRDPERSLQFYQEVVGAVAVHRDEESIQAQAPGSRDVLVFERTPERAGVPAVSPTLDSAWSSRSTCNRVSRLSSAQGAPCCERESPVRAAPFLFLDPDGYEVEIWFEPPTPLDQPGPQER